MDLSELIDTVQAIVQDEFWTSGSITTILNRGINTISKGVLLPNKYQLTPPLPMLYTVDTLDTVVGEGICDLPTDFQRDVVQVVNTSGQEIQRVASFRKFLEDNPEKISGSVRTCAPYGKRILYRDIPAEAETLEVHYYATPDELSGSSDEPDCIPENLQYKLLVGYACSHIFNLIEDGMEGQKLNTMEWRNQYYQGLAELEMEVGFDALADEYVDLTERIG